MSGRAEADTSISGMTLIFEASCTMGVNSFSMVTATLQGVFVVGLGVGAEEGRHGKEQQGDMAGYSLYVGICRFKFFEAHGDTLP